MAELIEFIKIAKEVQRRKPKSNETQAFMTNFETNIVALVKEINDRTYLPIGNYAFIITEPKPREIFATIFKNRIVHFYLYVKLMPLINEELTDRSYNNRVGYGTQKAIERVREDIYEMSDKYTRDCWIMKADIKGYFPNAKWDLVYKAMEDLVIRKYTGNDVEEILWLLKLTLYADPASTCEKRGDISLWKSIDPEKSLFNKEYGTGGAIGWLVWQMSMTYYLITLDKTLIKIPYIRFVRFVDDIVIIGSDKNKTLKVMEVIRTIVKSLGCELNETKFYFQHYTKGLEFLGTRIKFNRLYLNNKTINRMFNKISFINEIEDKKLNLEHVQQILNSYMGMLKNRTEFNIIWDTVIYKISSEWYIFFFFDWEQKCFKIRKEYTPNKNIKKIYEL